MAETHIVVLNGKRAGDDGIRQAVRHQRESGEDIQVRVTWEPEDIPRFVREARQLKAATVIAAGGDGTINAVCSALMAYPAEKRRFSVFCRSAPLMILPPQPEYRRIKPKPCFWPPKAARSPLISAVSMNLIILSIWLRADSARKSLQIPRKP